MRPTPKEFAVDLLERSVSTMAEVALALLTVNGASLVDLTAAGFWSAVGLAGIVAALKGVVASGIGTKNDASLVK